MKNQSYKHTFALLQVKNSNPNGDMDAAGAPRVLPSGHGHITSVAIKRKLRDFLNGENKELVFKTMKVDGKKNKIWESYNRGFDIKCDSVVDIRKEAMKKIAKIKTKKVIDEYWDSRVFGMMTKKGDMDITHKGCVNVSQFESLDPVEVNDVTITRKVRLDEKEGSTIGNQSYVEYGLYMGEIVCPASEVMTEDDVSILLNSLPYAVRLESSANRMIEPIAMFTVSKPNSVLGGGWPIHEVRKLFRPTLKSGIDLPTSLEDYDLIDFDTFKKTIKEKWNLEAEDLITDNVLNGV
tara:strand:- start:838 stop:1719 length:882 start_codon:yes stop_codon:yes gene_type:complete